MEGKYLAPNAHNIVMVGLIVLLVVPLMKVAAAKWLPADGAFGNLRSLVNAV